ncbi:MAG: DMT family transporter [Pseudomonadota bacterium]
MGTPTADPRALDWVMLAILGVIWGGAFMATKIATADFGAFAIAGLRLGVAAAASLLFLTLGGERLPGLATPQDRRFWAFAIAVGAISNAIPFTLLGWAQVHIDSALAGVIMATVPFFVLPLGHLFIAGEVMSWRKTAGFALGFCGILVLIGPGVLLDIGTGAHLALLAQLACLTVAVCYATGSIVSKRAPQHRGLLPFATAALGAAAVMTLPVALLAGDQFAPAPSWSSIAALLYLGLGPTAIATVMLLAVIRSAGPGFLALVNYQVPLWAVVFGVSFLGETPSPSLALALVLIVLGLAVAQGVLGLRRGGHARG